MAILVGTVIEVVLITVALTDLARRPRTQVRGPKPLWVLGCIVQPVGPIAYLAFGRARPNLWMERDWMTKWRPLHAFTSAHIQGAPDIGRYEIIGIFIHPLQSQYYAFICDQRDMPRCSSGSRGMAAEPLNLLGCRLWRRSSLNLPPTLEQIHG